MAMWEVHTWRRGLEHSDLPQVFCEGVDNVAVFVAQFDVVEGLYTGWLNCYTRGLKGRHTYWDQTSHFCDSCFRKSEMACYTNSSFFCCCFNLNTKKNEWYIWGRLLKLNHFFSSIYFFHGSFYLLKFANIYRIVHLHLIILPSGCVVLLSNTLLLLLLSTSA